MSAMPRSVVAVAALLGLAISASSSGARADEQVFVRTRVVEDLERVSAFFAARHQQVIVSPLTEIDAKKKTIELTFEITAP